MSSIYVSEPPTKGKLILHTTYGPLDIELWPKEAPKAVRNFVQLCLEGYYDNTLFHRIIKGFMVQGGDPTGTGQGGESIYGGYFSDEFHSRLRFNHRGLVACAGAGKQHTNGSQFFITLDRCDWIDRKHTIFGKVTGDSIYNLLRIGDIETDKDDRSVDSPPRITSVEVLWNPFDDIVPRVLPAKSLSSATTDTEKKDPKKKVRKNFNLLSFGEEAEEEEKEIGALKTKIKSSHDVLDDPRLLKEGNSSSEVETTKDVQLTVREALSSKKKESQKELKSEIPESLDQSDDDIDDASFDARMRRQIAEKQRQLGVIKEKLHKESSSPWDRETSPPRSDAENFDDQPKVDKLSLKKKGIGSEARAKRMANADSDLQLLGAAERERQLQKQKRRRRQGHEEEMLAKLEMFKASINAKSSGSNNQFGVRDDEDSSGWMGVMLKFAPDLNKDKMSRSEDPNDYVVHDPLLEKGKEKFNKMQARQKRQQREWAGRSLT